MFNVQGFIQDGRLGLCGAWESTLEHDTANIGLTIHVGITSILVFLLFWEEWNGCLLVSRGVDSSLVSYTTRSGDYEIELPVYEE